MEENRFEFALGWTIGILIRELHGQLVFSSFPWSAGCSWNFAFPERNILYSIGIYLRSSFKARNWFSSPISSFFDEAGLFD